MNLMQLPWSLRSKMLSYWQLMILNFFPLLLEMSFEFRKTLVLKMFSHIFTTHALANYVCCEYAF